ncbi:MAG: alpha-2-macroglobulin, partial [Bacteroidota bacterium]|nr:alpha-2-macroglobulin [Bacteroidota bacterium]
TDTKAFSFSKAGKQEIDFKEIKNINSDIRAHKLTFEYTGNAAWYAVQALPYLEQSNSKSVLSIKNRFYSNSIAKKIIDDNPEIEKVFKQWKASNSDALLSNLEKNKELKNILIQHTPWLLDAKNESEQKQKIALFFDDNKINHELQQDIYKLARKQTRNGGWAWFDGMKESRYISQNILEVLGHLKYLNAINTDIEKESESIIKKALSFIDDEMLASYNNIIKKKNFDAEKYSPASIDIHYLYSRSFFLDEYPVKEKYKKATSFIKKQAYEKRNRYNSYQKALIGLALNRFGEHEKAMDIVASLKEYSTESEEFGMYWNNFNRGWYWYQAPIENQAMMIELFDEVAKDKKAVEKMKLWLLKQKQTQNWSTSSATVKAVYALLSTGDNILTEKGDNVEIIIGKQKIDIAKETTQTGTSYFKKSWKGEEVYPDMSQIVIDKKDNTVSWGAMYWQYFTDLDKVKNYSTGVEIIKQFYKVEKTEKGEKLIEIGEDKLLKVGDRIRVRMILTSDRNLEYVHLQDMRAASFEPTETLSGYRYRDGFGYYQSINDASTDFFISYLRRGKYVFEYDLFVEQKGEFSNGITTFQSIYAPEFSAHSKGSRFKVQ